MKPVRSVLLALVFVSFATSLYAGNKALLLSSSDPLDGSGSILVDQPIQLTFSKNVVNFAIAEANSSCFRLETVSGTAVDIAVEMADDQIEPELKQFVTVRPVKLLESSVDYVLTISGALQAKNGQILGEDLSIRFRTGS